MGGNRTARNASENLLDLFERCLRIDVARDHQDRVVRRVPRVVELLEHRTRRFVERSAACRARRDRTAYPRTRSPKPSRSSGRTRSKDPAKLLVRSRRALGSIPTADRARRACGRLRGATRRRDTGWASSTLYCVTAFCVSASESPPSSVSMLATWAAETSRVLPAGDHVLLGVRHSGKTRRRVGRADQVVDDLGRNRRQRDYVRRSPASRCRASRAARPRPAPKRPARHALRDGARPRRRQSGSQNAQTFFRFLPDARKDYAGRTRRSPRSSGCARICFPKRARPRRPGRLARKRPGSRGSARRCRSRSSRSSCRRTRGRAATCSAAQMFAPDEMPTSIPSSRASAARRRDRVVVDDADHFVVDLRVEDRRERSPRPKPCSLCGPGLPPESTGEASGSTAITT